VIQLKTDHPAGRREPDRKAQDFAPKCAL